jgi:hypothetical protein
VSPIPFVDLSDLFASPPASVCELAQLAFQAVDLAAGEDLPVQVQHFEGPDLVLVRVSVRRTTLVRAMPIRDAVEACGEIAVAAALAVARAEDLVWAS